MSRTVDDATLTLRLAQGTGEILKGVRNVGLLRGRILGDAGDALSQEWIARVLEQHRPDDAVLSEEASDNEERLRNRRVWVIDPLDGTREFAGGRQDWAVHIALVEDGQPVHAAVGLPDLGQVFHTGEAKAVTGPMSGKIVVSRTRPPKMAEFVAEKLDRELVPMGSAGAKAMHVLLGDVDAYIHAGGQYEWDSAAPVGVCRAAGLHVSRLDGSEPSYNHEDTYLPDMLICRPEIADEILAAVKEYREANPED
ncbi:3'(2'),5'-bisphosphate nucleotidase CysQ [Corynebacterium sp. 335C]